MPLLSVPSESTSPARSRSAWLGRWLPVGVAVAGIGLTLAQWMGLNSDQNGRIDRQAEFEAAHALGTARDGLQGHVNSIAQGAERATHSDPELIRNDVGSYVGSNPACVGVARVDPDFRVTWIESRQTRSATTLAELGVADVVAQAIRDGRTVIARPPRSYWNGTRMLVIFAPERSNIPGSGGHVGVYRLQDLFASILNNVAAGYAIAVSDGSDTLFARYPAGHDDADRGKQSLALPFRDANWRLEAWPTGEALDRESLSLPHLALVVGLVTTALLALAVHLALTARRRARALEAEVRQRESTQRALVQSEEKYRSLIDHLGQGIFLQDREGRYVAANPQFCRAAARTEAEIIGRTDTNLFNSGRADRYVEEARTVLAEGKCVESEEDREMDGRRVIVRRALTPVRDAGGQTVGVLGICWDVTEQRQLEAHVQQASKMDAIGQLAGGIAHDFNNLLTAIIGNLELIQVVLPADDPAREFAEAAQGAANRASSLTRRLLGFARRHQLDWISVELNPIVEEVVVLLRRTIDPRIEIDTRLAVGLGSVRGDSAQLNQVLMNLCLNARDAITDAGRITVETATLAAIDLPAGHGMDTQAGEFVRLTVADTGSGMTDEVRDRMFEPFFTTKEVGKGTGLGLAMVFATVRQHKGWIACRSEIGRGTRFDIYLPRAEAAQPKHAAPTEPGPTRIGKETILVADDEDAVRRLAATALRRRGYTVVEVADGQQAVDVYRRDGDRIDLVILDLTMPVLSGQEAFRHLLRLNPHVRVVFASGYAAEHLTDLEKALMVGFVSKPYRPGELIAAVEDALQADAPPAAEPELAGCLG